MALRISSMGEAFVAGAPVFTGAPGAAFSTSESRIAPPGPLPLSSDSSTPFSAASCRAAGETRSAPSVAADGGGDAGAAAAASACAGSGSGSVAGAGASGSGVSAVSGGASPSARTVARGAPTGSSLPRSARISWTVPSWKISISIAPFWVSTTATTSPRWTVSPGFTSHSTSLPASMSAPSEGMTKTPISAAHLHAGGGDDPVHLRDRRLFQMRGVGDGHFLGTNAGHGAIERPEPALHDPRHDLGRERARAPALIHDHRAAGLAERGEDRGVIQWTQRAQVDHLGLDAVLRQFLGRLQRLEERAAIGDEAQVLALPPDRGLGDVHWSRILVDLPAHVVKHDVLEDQHRVGVLKGRPEHPPRILQRCGCQHLEAGDMRVPTLEAVGMLRGQLLAGAGGHADHHGHAELSARHVPDRGGRVHDLVEREQAEIDRHQLHDRPQPGRRSTDARAGETRLAERRVADAVLAELVHQTLRHRVASAIGADIFAHEKNAVVPLHRVADRLFDRLAIGRLHYLAAGCGGLWRLGLRAQNVMREGFDRLPRARLGGVHGLRDLGGDACLDLVHVGLVDQAVFQKPALEADDGPFVAPL